MVGRASCVKLRPLRVAAVDGQRDGTEGEERLKIGIQMDYVALGTTHFHDDSRSTTAEGAMREELATE
jgi:hypothetical protein